MLQVNRITSHILSFVQKIIVDIKKCNIFTTIGLPIPRMSKVRVRDT